MSAYPLLFTPGHIGRMPIKNRVLMASMVLNYADDRGRVTPKYLAHIERIARGGVGAMTLEAAYVSPDGQGFKNELGLHDDDVIPGLAQLADAAHRHDARIGIQLYHAGRQTSSAITAVQPVAPSAIPDPTINEVPRALEVEDIYRIVNYYAQGARRAQQAGFDYVEIHGAHGYLITQFLSSFSNQRADDYGGTPEKRMRFLDEVIEAVRGMVGHEFPVLLRLSGEEQVPKGLTIHDTIHIAKRAEMLGIDALHISAGNYASYERGIMISPMAMPDGLLLPLAAQVKQAVGIPVIAVNKIRSPELAEEALRDGKADFIALGRPFLADADWPRKAAEGRRRDINLCIACNQGCISRLFENLDVWCTVNPATAREQEFDILPPMQKKRVVVAGGGPAGMEAAKIAVERGHTVTLCEELDHLGGQLIAAEAAPYRPGWRELREYLLHEMERLQVDVRLNTRLTPALAKELGAETVIVAIGATPIRLKIPGAEGEHVIFARDLLEGTAEAHGRVVIAGGGCAGAQTAEYLATRSLPVVIAEMMGDIAVDAPRGERELLLARLHTLGVQMQPNTKIMRVESGKVVVERPTGTDEIPADTVVLCLGSVSNDSLARELLAVVPQVFVAGDAVEPRKVTEAMAEGAHAGLWAETNRGMGEVWRLAA